MNRNSVRPILPEPQPRGASPAKPAPIVATHRADSAQGKLFCMAFALTVCIIPIRAVVVGFDWHSLTRPFDELPKIILAACYDVLLITIITSVFALLLWIARRNQGLQKFFHFSFILLALGLLLVGMANVEVVRMLGRPFNYQWFYYSDFMRSPDALNSVRMSLEWKMASLATWFCLAMLAIAKITHWIVALIYRRGMRVSTVLAAILPLLAAYLFFAHWFFVTQQWPMARLANPVAEFAISAVRSARAPALFTMPTPVSFDLLENGAAGSGTSNAPRNPQVKNVVIYVLESVPAEYVQAYGGRYPVTPNLSRYLDRAVLFEDIYAHAPATNKSLVSMLCSAYPWVSYRTLTQEHPDVSLDAISHELHKHGSRTAFFASGDLVYQGAGAFLAYRGFDLIQDYRKRRNARRDFESKEYPYLNGTDDRATVHSLVEWIDKEDQRPFFAMLWTLATHHPYMCVEEEIDFGVSEKSFNRYLNALKQSDEAFGELMKALEQRKLLDSTLVVVVGDHGEAFGRHNQWGHGTQIYEENLRVPLILINPTLFKGQRQKLIGGLVDLAPTIMDVLGHAPPSSWHGKSLFASNRSGRAYFFAPWSDFLFGYREGDWKLIYNATTDRVEVYDLKSDPYEVNNLASRHPEFVGRAQQYLAAWVQHQQRFYARAFGDASSLATSD